ncbi:MAG: hypothetical protein A2046_14960 [Bacteroidetes bacterium GWA2_30_7]|nr:MAG: hypothetical protein A2046_14960 [Bacteroidetes bacterium GWA2_30_7]
MKKNTFIIFLLLICKFLFASPVSDSLVVQEYYLENGLKIILNEDTNVNYVYGAVVVKGGSKFDPDDATGIAHYLEHLMFKGTAQIGTINYAEEKIYLDSITKLYDSIPSLTDTFLINAVLKKINQLSVKASDYAIPDELDLLMQEIGCSDINAYTSEDCIVYHNSFPSEQIYKWLDITSQRFVNPVFRMFQAELDVVYEEKNIYADEWFSNYYETFMSHFFKNHPYGQHTIIGSFEHLRKPSISKMYDYYNKYYVANNMALILTGNFKSEEIKDSIIQLFSSWRKANLKDYNKIQETNFNGREQYKMKLTPLRVGSLGFRTAPAGSDDENALELINEMLENSSETGFLNNLHIQNKLVDIDLVKLQLIDYGGIMIYYIPKMLQSLKNVEKKTISCLSEIKNGNFDDEYFDFIKNQAYKNHIKELEVINEYDNEGANAGRLEILISNFVSNKSWTEYIQCKKNILNITREEVIDVANKYFNDNYLTLYSKKGNLQIDKLEIAKNEKLSLSNKNSASEYGNYFRNLKNLNPKLKLLELHKDVLYDTLSLFKNFYYTYNPYNELYSFEINIGVGLSRIPMLKFLADFLTYSGSENYPMEEFKSRLLELGSDMKIESDENFFKLKINGLDSTLVETVELINELLSETLTEKLNLNTMANSEYINRKFEINDPAIKGEALIQFLMYDTLSIYASRPNIKQLYKTSANDLKVLLDSILKFETDIMYSGKLDYSFVKGLIYNNLSAINPVYKSNSPYFPEPKNISENEIFFNNDPNAQQSQIYFYIKCPKTDSVNQAISNLFTTYLNDLVYNEIRNQKSLSYNPYVYFQPTYKDESAFLLVYLSTQAENTEEALQSVLDILKNFKIEKSKFETLKNALIYSINTGIPSFRKYSELMLWRLKRNKTDDPVKYKFEIYKSATEANLEQFFNENIKSKPIVIGIVGDKSKFNIEKFVNFSVLEIEEEGFVRE